MVSKMKDTTIKKKLERAYWRDQKLRAIFVESENPFFRLMLSCLIFLCDKLNRQTLSKIIVQNGWPSYSKHGVKASDAAYYIVQHSSKDYMEKYIKLLKCAAFKGEAKMAHLAAAQDRLLMYRGKNQIYGTQIKSTNIEGKRIDFIWPITNPNKVNIRRKKMGIDMTIEEYKVKNGLLS